MLAIRMSGTGIVLLLRRHMNVDFEKNLVGQFFLFNSYMPSVTDGYSGRGVKRDVVSGWFQKDNTLSCLGAEGQVQR